MKIEQFQYFVEVARQGSISSAARKCYISQAAMSQQMNALEEALGVKLLKRSRSGTCLTENGELFLPKAEKLLNDYQDILDNFQCARDVNKITVSYAGHLEQELLLKALPHFTEWHEDIDVQIHQYPMTKIEEELLSGACDIALSILGEIEGKDFHHVSLLKCPVEAAVSSRSPLAGESSLTLDQLREERVVVLREDASLRVSKSIQKWLISEGWQADQILYADTIESQILMVNLNEGFTFLPSACHEEGICNIPLDITPPIFHETEAVYLKKTTLLSEILELLSKEAAEMLAEVNI